jgi:hypothetical protein
MMNGFMYGNIYEDNNRYERQAIFPKLLCSNADDFSMSNTSFNRDAVKAGTGRRYNFLCLLFEFILFKKKINFNIKKFKFKNSWWKS